MQSTKNVLIEDLPITRPIISWLTEKGYNVLTSQADLNGLQRLDYLITTQRPETLFKRRFKRLPLGKKTRKADKIILWRIEGSKKPSKEILDAIDEIWVIARTNLATITPIRHVPFLLNSLPQVSVGKIEDRQAKILVIAPETYPNQIMAKTVAQSTGFQYGYFSAKEKKEVWKLSDEAIEYEFSAELASCAMLICLYSPEQDHFTYSDPPKIKQALAHGLPVITTNMPPIWKEIEHKKAGVVLKEFFIDQLKLAVTKIYEDWEDFSINARKLAEEYVIDSNWVDLSKITLLKDK